ncbi:MAG: LemA family protein [Planctomycetes bacterium]|nr:LemA family protein [Planctomycetota bacterium]
MEYIPICIGAAIMLSGLVFIAWWIITLQRLTQLSGQVDLTIGTLAAQYQQRFDLMPDVLQAAKEAVKAQKEYLDRMLEIRKGMHPGLTPMDLGSLPPDYVPMAVAASAAAAGKPVSESNPEMNVEGYTEFQRIAKDTEKDVAAARRFYWAAVAEYNTSVNSFPGSIVAAVHGFRPLPSAEITEELATKPNYF